MKTTHSILLADSAHQYDFYIADSRDRPYPYGAAAASAVLMPGLLTYSNNSPQVLDFIGRIRKLTGFIKGWPGCTTDVQKRTILDFNMVRFLCHAEWAGV